MQVTKKPFDRTKSVRCIEYWLARGYSEEAGRAEISKRQRRSPEVYRKAAEAKQTDDFRRSAALKAKEVNTLQYWIDRHGEERGRTMFEKRKQLYIDNGVKTSSATKLLPKEVRRERSHFCTEYWIKAGHSEEEAADIISKAAGRGLRYYIDKYGEEDGKKRFDNRQQKWQETFTRNNDMEAVNQKRRNHAHIGLYSDKHIDKFDSLTFYLVIFSTDSEIFLKFGLTKHDGAKQRWGLTHKGAIVNSLIEWRGAARAALQLEQNIKRQFASHAYSPAVIKTTEALDISCNEAICKFIYEELQHENGKYVTFQNDVCRTLTETSRQHAEIGASI